MNVIKNYVGLAISRKSFPYGAKNVMGKDCRFFMIYVISGVNAQ